MYVYFIFVSLSNIFFHLCIRYSSDDTDDDTNTNVIKKKKSSNLRRQTLANPMPPPSIIPPDATNVTKNPVKENLSPPHSEFKDPNATDFDNSSVSSTTRVTSKTTHNKFIKTQRSYASDGLETGSDSDVVEDTGSTYVRSYDKYLSNPSNRLSDTRVYDRGSFDYDQTSKTRPVHITKDMKYNVSPVKPSVSSIQFTKEDVSGRDITNQKDLASYETPFLSEFTRRLSSQSLINTSLTLPNLKSKRIFFYACNKKKEKKI